MAKVYRVGFGQVEPNHLSAQRNGQIYAQLPADRYDILENGQFVKYNYAAHECTKDGDMEWMLVFNEVKLYDGWRETYKDFAMIKENYTPDHYSAPKLDEDGNVVLDDDGNEVMEDFMVSHDFWGPFRGQMVPRVFKTHVGDIMVTNCLVGPNTKGNKMELGEDTDFGNGALLGINKDGFLDPAAADTSDMVWQVTEMGPGAKCMPDGQFAVKIQRIK